MKIARKIKKQEKANSLEATFFGKNDWILLNSNRIFRAGKWKKKEDCIPFVNALNAYLTFLEQLDEKLCGVDKVEFQVFRDNIVGFDSWTIRSNVVEQDIPFMVLKCTPVIDEYMIGYAKSLGMEKNIIN